MQELAARRNGSTALVITCRPAYIMKVVRLLGMLWSRHAADVGGQDLLLLLLTGPFCLLKEPDWSDQEMLSNHDARLPVGYFCTRRSLL